MCNQDTVQIRSRYGCHFDTHSDFNFLIQFKYAPDTEAILILIQIPPLDTVQIRSKTRKPFLYSFRFNFWYSPDTHQTRKPLWYSFKDTTWYSSDTLQTRKPFWYSYRINLLIIFKYTLNTDAILMFKHTNYISTSILGWHLQAHLQQDSTTSPKGIYKPIPNKILLPLQMVSLSPFLLSSPSANFWEL